MGGNASTVTHRKHEIHATWTQLGNKLSDEEAAEGLPARD